MFGRAPKDNSKESEERAGFFKRLRTRLNRGQSRLSFDLANLFRQDHDQEQAEVETEWEIFQKAPAGENGGNEVKDKDLLLNDHDKALIRRYEFYKYLGPVSAEGEADCKSACEKDPLGLDPNHPHPSYVGEFVGAQMAGINVAEDQGPINIVPEPHTYALLAAGLLMAGMVAHRRRLRV